MKPCPFCGHQMTDPYWYTKVREKLMAIECPQCGARGPFVEVEGGQQLTQRQWQSTEVLWNQRK